MMPGKSLFTRVLSLLALGLTAAASASTLPVSPGSYPTIQAAIDAASDGDEVVVPPGTYAEEIRFHGKAITVRSTDGPEVTFLSGANLEGGVVLFVDEEGRDSVLEGFTVSSSEAVAPIVIEYAAPTVRNCIIESNYGFYTGGILISEESDALIERCTIHDNNGSDAGAILIEGSYATIRRCQILDNYGYGTGGIRIEDSTVDITNCLIAYNWTDSESSDAGGVTVRSYGQSTISNCTIANNSTEYGDFGGVAIDYGSLVVGNTIIWNNSPDGIGYIGGGRGDYVAVYFSDVQNGWEGFGEGNIAIDPVFINVETDFRLSSGSACIDTGSNSLIPEGTYDDLAGHARRLDDPVAPDCAQRGISCGDAPVVDMGAYERCATGHVAFLSVPCHARAGQTLFPRVAVLNQCGEIDAGAYGEVELTLESNPTGAELNGNRTVALYAGVAEWNSEDGLNITVAGCGYRFLATYRPGEGQPAPTDGDTGVSDSFTIRPGCMDHLSFDDQPSDTQAGTAIMTAVSVRDAYENLVHADGLLIVLSIGVNPTEATLGGQYFGLTDQGVACWSYPEYLNITKAAMGYTLTAEVFEGPDVTRGGLSGESDAFEIYASLPRSLAFAHQPQDTTAGSPISVEVELRDEFGNRADSNDIPIVLSLESNPGNAPLGGTTQVLSNEGVASWDAGQNLHITVADAGYTLRARDDSQGGGTMRSGPSTLDQAVSSTFRILHAAPTQLAFAAQPSDALVNTAFGPPIVVAILDPFGNLATSASNEVSLAIGTNPAGGSLTGGGPVAAAHGIATFASASISASGDGYTLLAKSEGLQTASSVGFNVLSNAPAPNPNPYPPPIDLIGDGSAQDVLLSVLFRNALCGMGAVAFAPATVLGLMGMKRRNRRR